MTATNPVQPSKDGWRTFDSLDLEKPTVKKNGDKILQGRLKGLDLAEEKHPISKTAMKMKQYAQHAHNVALFPGWKDSMSRFTEHKITDSSFNKLTCESMKTKIDGEISAIREGVDYNGLNVVIDFIKFCEQERKINPKLNNIELFHRFQPDSRDEASRTHGSTCVGKAWEIVKRLKEMENPAEAHVIIESGKYNEPPLHAAVAVPCTDGVLLVEIEHSIPIVSIKPSEPYTKDYPGNPSLKLSIEIIEVPGNYKTSTPLLVKKEVFNPETATKKNSYRQYVLRPDTDPDQSVMKRWLVSKHTWFYPVSSGKREGQEQHSIQVNVAPTPEYPLGKITFSIGKKKFRIPLEAFDPISRTINRSKLSGEELDEEGNIVKISPDKLEEYKDIIFGIGADGHKGGKFFQAFKSKDLLMDQIFTIIAHREMLKDLREK